MVRLHIPPESRMVAAVAGGADLLIQLPWLTRLPAGWDSAQFTMAVRHFDMAQHLPHPPGYYLYVCLGQLLHAFGLPPYQSLLVISVIATSVMVALVTYWAAEIAGWAAGVATALLAVTSPLLVQFGTQGDSYALSGLLSATVGYLCWREHRDPRRFPLSSLALAAAAGVRPTDALFLLPLWAVTQWHGGLRRLLLGGGLLAISGLMWIVPLLREVGGWERYHELLALQEQFVRDRAPLLGHGDWSAAMMSATALGLALTLGCAWLLVALTLQRPWRKYWPALLLWVLPALTFYAFVHIGSLGYLTLVLPGLLVLTGAAVGGWLQSQPRVAIPAVLLVCLSSVMLLGHPVLVGRQQRQAQLLAAQRVAAKLAGHDTLVLAPSRAEGPEGRGSLLNFRLAMYLFPDATVCYMPPERALLFGSHPNIARGWEGQFVDTPQVIPGIRRLLVLDDSLLRFVPARWSSRRVLMERDIHIREAPTHPTPCTIVLHPDGRLTVQDAEASRATASFGGGRHTIAGSHP